MIHVAHNPYSSVLQTILRSFFHALNENNIPYIALRNAAVLPETSGFDIDLLAAEEHTAFIAASLSEIAEQHDAVFIGKSDGKRGVVFAPSFENNVRSAAIVDVQNNVNIGSQDVDVEEVLGARGRKCLVHCASSDWDLLFRLVQAVRKKKYDAALREEFHTAFVLGEGTKVIERYVGDRQRLVVEMPLDQWFGELGRQLGISPYKSQSSESLSSLERLKRFVFMECFFLHYHRIPFIVVSGPDGVGKSTLIQNVLGVFKGFPLDTDGFHHTMLSKQKKNENPSCEMVEPSMSLVRKMRRRFTPQIIKNIYSSVMSEAHYARTLNRQIYNNFYSGVLSFSDRYIYDRVIKMDMLAGKTKLARIATKITSALMRKPFLMIVPTDCAEHIFRRKQELQPDEIEAYYVQLKTVAGRCGFASVIELDVAGKTPEDLALEASRHIILSLSDIIFHSIGAYEARIKNT